MTDPVRVWFRFMRLEARIRQAMGARLRELGLSIAQTDVLTVLTEREGMSQQDLAQRLYVTKGNISGLIDRLEAAGHVERRSIASDRRSHALFLTQSGKALAGAAIEAQKNFVSQTLGRLSTSELEEFEGVIQQLRNRVRGLIDDETHYEQPVLTRAEA